MSNSNNRDKSPEKAYHLISRIAHRVYFLEDDERSDFLEIVRRAAEFAGIELLGWCVMTNHFHLLVYLPAPRFVDEPEVLRRYGVLKGAVAAEEAKGLFAEWRRAGESGEGLVEEWLDRQRRRMYDVGAFMKIVKQWFSEEYNRRHSHKGTLWESAYYSRTVASSEPELAKCLGYIHLNPIRAAVSASFDGYAWSSFAAFRKGDPTAVRGMRFVYGWDHSDADVANRHEALLETLLEAEKQRRAEEIARKRAAGFALPADPLTTEAMIAQKAAQLAEMQKASMRLREEMSMGMSEELWKSARAGLIKAEICANPCLDVAQIAERAGVSVRTAYRLLADMRRRGDIAYDSCGTCWTLAKQVRPSLPNQVRPSLPRASA